jgi:hypothetical protein
VKNPYCKHGTHHAIRCFSCEIEKRQEKKALMSLIEETEAMKSLKRRKAAERKIKEAAKRLNW